jgi:PadR family transcriptional regulator PadR
MGDERTELLQGTLELLILKTLAMAPEHGWGIAQRIQQNSRDALSVNQGSLYPALQRLERDGAVVGKPGLAANNRRVNVYHLTPAGRRLLVRQVENWNRFADAVGLILNMA